MLSKIFQFLLIRQLNENTPLEILNHLQRRLKLKTQTPHYFTSVKNSLLYQIHHNIKNSPLYKSNTQMPKEYHN